VPAFDSPAADAIDEAAPSEAILDPFSVYRKGEELLRQACVSHCHLWFYRDAMDATLAASEWAAALHFANALEAYVREEPLPWATLFVARTRALVAAGRDGADSSTAAELQRLHEEARRAHLGSALPAIDAALARA